MSAAGQSVLSPDQEVAAVAAVSVPSDESIPARFARQVQLRSESPAIIAEGSQMMMYGELDRLSNQIAHAIIDRCPEPHQRIVLLLDHDTPAIAAMLGALKSGNAYVPLDPTYPEARTAYMIEDADAAVVITDSANRELAERLTGSGRPLIDVDSDLSVMSDSDPGIESVPRDHAYIIYTSGSTGQPKGVIQNHRNLLHYIDCYTRGVGIHSDDRLSLFYSFAFSASLMDIWGGLLNGATIYRYDLKKRGLNDLPGWLRENRISVYHSVPTVFRHLMDTLDEGETFPSIRVVDLGGEPVFRRDVEAFRKHFAPGCRLVNHLAFTEASVTAQFPIEHDTQVLTDRVPVGRAAAGMEVVILDEHGGELGTGEIGELAVRGRYLSPGYWNKPELTDASFSLVGPANMSAIDNGARPTVSAARPANEFAPSNGTKSASADWPIRLYRTGDLGRVLPDGCVEHLGRKDSRVKIRGFSVEVAEIEQAILRGGGVREAAVVAHEVTAGDPRLVAYLVPARDDAPSVAELRARLSDCLPDYMIPGAFVRLDSLPLTDTGKVNPRALPAPSFDDDEAGFTTPRNSTESKLCEIVEQVLGIERVGVQQSLFSLGAHSLHIMQIVSRVRRAFGIALPLQSVFETPTIEAMAERITAVQGSGFNADTPLVPQTRNGPIPLTSAQERVWFLDQLEQGTAAYNLLCALRLEGPLDAAALSRSVNAVAERHESLRTVIRDADGSPTQVVLPHQPQELEISDLQASAAEHREDEARRLAVSFARVSYDLAVGPLWRMRLLRLGDEDHLLLVGIHHIATDGWSRSVLFDEIMSHYEAVVTRGAPALNALPIHYADYAIWQRGRLVGDALDEQRAYWTGQLADIPTLEMPLDRQRRAVPSYEGDVVRMSVTSGVTARLKELSRSEGATLYMTLLAAFSALLSRHSGQDDIVVGSPIANRTRPEVEHLIGFFANTLALRTDLSGDPTVRELLARVRETATGAYAHQDMPFESLVEALQPERRRDRNPLFQVMLIQHNPPFEKSAGGLSVREEEILLGTALFDLTVIFRETADGLELKWEYATDLFDRATIERMCGHFGKLLEAFVSEPDGPVSRLPHLTCGEAQQILYDWNATALEYPRQRCIHELIEEQAQRTPDAVAVVAGKEQLSYRQLDLHANQLARCLQKRGVGPESLVGVCVDRSAEMLVALLGILKSGGTYVPLDPSWPRERLALIAGNSDLELVITQSDLGDAVPDCIADRLHLGDESDEDSAAVTSAVTPDNLAYVLHTSGSTGVPKGVQLSHRAVVNFLSSMAKKPGVTAEDVLVAVTTISFDIAGLELYLPLIVGGRVVIANREDTLDGGRLANLLTSSGATAMQATPATWQMLLASGWRGDSKLKVLCGGEALPADLASRLLGCCSELWNMYGPTETTIWSSVERIANPEQMISIGRPIANTQMYILDRRLQPVPVGVTGELYIGGDGVARGYLNRPELTAEKFLPNPFAAGLAEDSGFLDSRIRGNDESIQSRIYRTGDLARFLPDGRIECLGRVDHQVKLRGFRIELGEIESVLRQVSGVREAVVVIRDDLQADRRLVGYLVTESGREIEVSELWAHLAARVPEYMIPSAFVHLPVLPLTPNGKLDRKALPAPTTVTPTDRKAVPRTETEKVLADIWKELLHLDSVGIDDNFFAVGGHSLLVVRMFAEVERRLGTKLAIATIFTASTIRSLAAILDRKDWSPDSKCLAPIRVEGTRAPFFWIHHALGDALYAELIARYMPEDVPVYGIQSLGLDGMDEPLSKLEEMAALYIQEMKKVQPDGPYYLGGYSLGIIAFEMAQQLVAQGDRVGMLALLDPECPVRSKSYPNRSYLFERKLIPWMLKTEHGLRELRQMGAFSYAGERIASAREAIGRQAKKVFRRSKPSGPLHPVGRIYKLNMAAVKAYRPRPYPGKVTYFYAAERLPALLNLPDTRLGWSEFAEGGFEVHLIPGNHNSGAREPHVRVLGQKLSACLERAYIDQGE